MMEYFTYKKGQLYCEGVAVKALAAKFGTPLYVYSAGHIRSQLGAIRSVFAGKDLLVCYSVKANSNLSLLKLVLKENAGLDIVSGGELYRAKTAKCPPKRIVYASVGKTEKEISEAIRYGIRMFNVESLAELRTIDRIAAKLKEKVSVALRFNPDIDADTHAYITTGKKDSKFGIDEYTIKAVCKHRKAYPQVNIEGIHMHIGSQITNAAGYVRAVKKAVRLIKDLRAQGISLEVLNLGGGFGIAYDSEKVTIIPELKKKVVPLLKGLKVKLVIEPGRFVVGNAGVFVTKVIYTKENAHKRFLIVDGAMNDLMRPSLYGAYHRIIPVSHDTRHTSHVKVDVVGPVCETGDFLGKKRDLTACEGECLAVLGAGAYGFTMSSQYNSRPRSAEVLVDGTKAKLIRKRETYKDLIDKEIGLTR